MATESWNSCKGVLRVLCSFCVVGVATGYPYCYSNLQYVATVVLCYVGQVWGLWMYTRESFCLNCWCHLLIVLWSNSSQGPCFCHCQIQVLLLIYLQHSVENQANPNSVNALNLRDASMKCLETDLFKKSSFRCRKEKPQYPEKTASMDWKPNAQTAPGLWIEPGPIGAECQGSSVQIKWSSRHPKLPSDDLNFTACHPGADPRMVRISTAPPPFWQINHANSAYFRLFLGYFRVISSIRSPLLDLGPPFLHILDPPLSSVGRPDVLPLNLSWTLRTFSTSF